MPGDLKTEVRAWVGQRREETIEAWNTWHP